MLMYRVVNLKLRVVLFFIKGFFEMMVNILVKFLKNSGIMRKYFVIIF